MDIPQPPLPSRCPFWYFSFFIRHSTMVSHFRKESRRCQDGVVHGKRLASRWWWQRKWIKRRSRGFCLRRVFVAPPRGPWCRPKSSSRWSRTEGEREGEREGESNLIRSRKDQRESLVTARWYIITLQGFHFFNISKLYSFIVSLFINCKSCIHHKQTTKFSYIYFFIQRSIFHSTYLSGRK